MKKKANTGNNGFAHHVPSDALVASRLMGINAVAACGLVYMPSHGNPDGLPTCPDCDKAVARVPNLHIVIPADTAL